MGAELEAMGDIATGALVARAVDGAVAAPAHGHAAHGACLDCGTALVGAHCHACGQPGHLHSTLGGFAHEVLHGVAHFEGKVWRTLPMLALRPGHLTRRYIEGERTKFVTPFALFLFSVFLMFAVVAQLPAFTGTGDAAAGVAGGFGEARREIARGAADARRDIARLERSRVDLVRGGLSTAVVDRRLAEARDRLGGMEVAERMLPGAGEASPKVRAEVRGTRATQDGAERWLQRLVDHARENPKLFIYKMKSAGYKYSWALIPISLPFIWLLFFRKRGFGMYDHAVFATYSLAFMSLMVVALSLVISFAPGVVAGFAWAGLVLIPPVHMYKQLKHGYRLSRFSAAWRTFVLLNIVCVAAILFFLLLLYLGAG